MLRGPDVAAWEEFHPRLQPLRHPPKPGRQQSGCRQRVGGARTCPRRREPELRLPPSGRPGQRTGAAIRCCALAVAAGAPVLAPAVFVHVVVPWQMPHVLRPRLAYVDEW